MSISRKAPPSRLTENSTFSTLTDITGKTIAGTWRIVRGVGDLGYASVVCAQDERTGAIVPMGSVLRLEV